MSDFRWSFSQWETYNGCPAKWKYQSVLKLPRQPPGPAAARGLQIHETVENYIKGQSPVFHPAVKPKYKSIFDQFKDHPNGDRHCELKIGLTEDWTLVGGFRGTTWCSMVLDAVRVGGDPYVAKSFNEPCVAWVAEWKSGKPKETHGEQRKMYALGALVRWSYVDEVHVTTYYLEDTEVPQRLKVTPSAESKLKDLWKSRVDQMRGDAYCAPKPGMHCNWCDFAKRKGGPCVF